MPKKKRPSHQSFESRTDHGRFVKITVDMLTSAAWQALTVYEQGLYLAIKGKYRGLNRNGQDNSRDLSFTYDEGRLMMSPERFTKAVDRLIATGLIDMVEHLPQARRPTIYGLSDRWHDYGEAHFKEQKRPKLERQKKRE